MFTFKSIYCMSKKEKVLLGLILFYLFTLFFPKLVILTIVSVIALLLYSIFYSSVKEKWALLKERRHLQGMLLFFGWIVISVLLSSNTNKALSFLDPRLALFYFPLCIGTLQLRKRFSNNVLLGFALLTTVMSVVCLGYGLQRSHFFQQPEFLYNDALTEVLGQQSIYISLLVNISIFIFVYFLLFTPFKYKGWLLLATIILFGFSYLLASRTMMLLLYLVTFGFCLYYILNRKKYLEGATLVMGLLIGVFLIFKFFPQTINRFKELSYTSFNYQSMGRESHYNMALTIDQWNGANFRLAAWRCGWELFKEHPVVGVHLGDKRDELFKKYAEKNFQFAITTNKNVHNNYLDVLYSLGIIGFVLFLVGWIILPVIYAAQFKDGLAILITLTFAAAWITEIYFDRNLGGMLTGFFIPFVLTRYKKERQP